MPAHLNSSRSAVPQSGALLVIVGAAFRHASCARTSPDARLPVSAQKSPFGRCSPKASRGTLCVSALQFGHWHPRMMPPSFLPGVHQRGIMIQPCLQVLWGWCPLPQPMAGQCTAAKPAPQGCDWLQGGMETRPVCHPPVSLPPPPQILAKGSLHAYLSLVAATANLCRPTSRALTPPCKLMLLCTWVRTSAVANWPAQWRAEA